MLTPVAVATVRMPMPRDARARSRLRPIRLRLRPGFELASGGPAFSDLTAQYGQAVGQRFDCLLDRVLALSGKPLKDPPAYQPGSRNAGAVGDLLNFLGLLWVSLTE